MPSRDAILIKGSEANAQEEENVLLGLQEKTDLNK
jgi:hypothetical protein